jgi:hypothetical protein
MNEQEVEAKVAEEIETMVWNGAQNDPWELRGVGRPLGVAALAGGLEVYPEHTFFRALCATGFGRRAFVIFACDCHGQRQYEATCFLRKEDGTFTREEVAYHHLATVLVWLGNHFCFEDVEWNRIPLPPGHKP